jgi:hypothetical protein
MHGKFTKYEKLQDLTHDAQRPVGIAIGGEREMSQDKVEDNGRGGIHDYTACESQK